jgi:siroheme synthase-like protein
MNKFLPLSIDLNNKSVIVAGGGKVALRKVKILFEYGADIIVIAEKILESELSTMSLERKIQIKERKLISGDLHDAFLVVMATNDKKTNDIIAEFLNDKNILVNNASGKGNVAFPAIFIDGDLSVAVSTSGTSPSFAVKIKDLIGSLLGNKYRTALELTKDYRIRAKNEIPDSEKRRMFIKELNDIDIHMKDFSFDEFEKKTEEIYKRYHNL